MSRAIVTTPRLRLEPFENRHLSLRYVGWLNDPEVVRFSEQRHRHHTMETNAAYVRSFENSPHYLWAIVERESDLGHVGNISAYVDGANGTADVGILIGDKRAWGRGYGGEAWNAVCAFLLHEGRMRKVTGGTVATNAAMLAIMRRAGMREDGRRIRQMIVDGGEVDLVHMAMFAAADQL